MSAMHRKVAIIEGWPELLFLANNGSEDFLGGNRPIFQNPILA